jgi:hypothetical protein
MLWQTDRTKINSEFAGRVSTIPDSAGGHWVAVQGFRSPAYQNSLYAKGRTVPGEIVTNAKEYQSPHTVTSPIAMEDGTPDSHAVDLAWQDEHGNLTYNYNEPQWAELRAFVDAAPGMHGGWHFPSPDEDHIQGSEWPAIRAAIIAAGKW